MNSVRLGLTRTRERAMKKEARDYYARFAPAYSRDVRKLVPRYDEMTGLILELLKACSPVELLDIGPGTGELDRQVLKELPRARLLAVEASPEMHAAASSALGDQGSRAHVHHADIADFEPDRRFDAVFTNLVLHNVGFEEKQGLLGRIRSWLNPGGVFVWGDMIRFESEAIQQHFVAYRRRHALTRGADPGFVDENFRKEAALDSPLTVPETLEWSRQAGFASAEMVWAHDTFAVFLLA